MLNKNYIIIVIGVILVAAIAGFVLLSRNGLPPDSSALEKGTKNLTRDAAADMIETFLKVNPGGGIFGGGKTKRYNQNQLGNYSESYMTDSDVQILKNFEAGGFIKILSEENTSAPYVIKGENIIEGKKTLTFDFTKQAEPYFVKQKNTALDDKNVEVLLGEVVSVEVTGITEPTEGIGGNARIANYTAKYKATPIGKVIDEKAASEEIRSRMPFMLYDDGWRIQLGQ